MFLHFAIELLEPPQKVTPHAGKVILSFTMPVHSISLLSITSATM
jgi:hypothetical protein